VSYCSWNSEVDPRKRTPILLKRRCRHGEASEAVPEGLHVGRKRVARLMRLAGLCGASRRHWKQTTRQRAGARRAPDLVRRHFSAGAPNVLWVADATYIPTGEGFLYLAVVLDVFSRRIVGWAMSNHLYTELMLRALDMALAQRRPEHVIHHSDSKNSVHVHCLRAALSRGPRATLYGHRG
jgi:transposase InsO family protein